MIGLKIWPRLRCSKSLSTTNLPDIIYILQSIECLYLALLGKKGPRLEGLALGLGFLIFSCLSDLGLLEDMIF